VTTVSRTLLDLASSVPFNALRRALAEAEYRRLVELEEVGAVLGRGQPGSAALRMHAPELARTRSRLDERFLDLCESYRIARPEVNVQVHGFTVDAIWRDQGLVVELDGGAAHGTYSAVARDRQRDLALREKGFRVRRYSDEQVSERPGRVAADVLAALAA
jgi:very-short-patch-repair endonuclease